jgi:hypothetical protein
METNNKSITVEANINAQWKKHGRIGLTRNISRNGVLPLKIDTRHMR